MANKCLGDVCPKCQRRTWHKWETDKQRTQIFKEVRGKVISERVGNILGVCLCCEAIRSGEGSVEPHKQLCLNGSVEIILKKLKAIEGSND